MPGTLQRFSVSRMLVTFRVRLAPLVFLQLSILLYFGLSLLNIVFIFRTHVFVLVFFILEPVQG